MASSEDTVTIPSEIITEILYRLPAKSVGRFRCVSKDWLSLLSSPQFIKTHQKTLNRNHIIFISIDLSLCALPFNHHEKELSRSPTKLRLELPPLNLFTFHGSCNGLVLASLDDLNCDHKLLIFNPTTRELVALPVSGYEMVDDLLEIDITYGFGYDSVSDDYKVVTISYFHFNYLISPDCMSVHIYSPKNNTWKRVTDSPYDHSYGKSLPGVFVNGFLHWFAKKSGSHDLQVIVAFSIADEKFSEVASPNVDIGSKDDCRLIDLGGKLAIFFEVQGEIWLMNEYGVKESWTKILLNRFNDILIVEPMILYDNGKMLLVTRDQMWIYDFEEGIMCERVDIQNLKDFKVGATCVESLVSPKFS